MKRILLKLSGEAMAGEQGFGIYPPIVQEMAKGIKAAVDAGYEVSVVPGGGNIWRGIEAEQLGMERSQADYMGMMATMLNGLALQDALESQGCQARVMTSLHTDQVAEPYIRRRAIRHLEKGKVVILSGGTGMPYFSTDTNSMIKAAELKCDVVLMAKNGVNGVYDKDPNKYDDAVRYDKLTYTEILEKQLRVMDLTASSMAEENSLNSIVFNLGDEESILGVLEDNSLGTIITK